MMMKIKANDRKDANNPYWNLEKRTLSVSQKLITTAHNINTAPERGERRDDWNVSQSRNTVTQKYSLNTYTQDRQLLGKLRVHE